MPRRKLIFTDEFPYHVYARSDNQEWFYIRSDLLWKIFGEQLIYVSLKYRCQIHSFVQMGNHYHMLISASAEHPLHKVMQELQKRVSKIINHVTGRTNHIFGGPYKGSLITTPRYYFNVYKYIFRNPVEARICQSPFEYKYSTLNNSANIPIVCSIEEIADLIPYPDLKEWLETDKYDYDKSFIFSGLMRPEFKPVTGRQRR